MLSQIKSRVHTIGAFEGLGPEKADRVINPLYWAHRFYRRVRLLLLRFYERYLGLSRVLLRDVHSRDATISLIKGVRPNEFIVTCQIIPIQEIRRVYSHEEDARLSFLVMRDEVWNVLNQVSTWLPHEEEMEKLIANLDRIDGAFKH